MTGRAFRLALWAERPGQALHNRTCERDSAFKRAGAVRAMEFDINPEWHTLITYTHQRRHLVATMVEPQPMQSVTRYLVPGNRDFFAVYRRMPGPVTVPFK